MKQAAKLITVGFIGGSIVASFVLSFTALIGRLGDSGSNHIGYWNIGVIGLGIVYGGPSGIVLVFLARLILFRIAIDRFYKIGAYAGLLALVGGGIGGIKNPFYAAAICLVTFSISIVVIGWLGSRNPSQANQPAENDLSKSNTSPSRPEQSG